LLKLLQQQLLVLLHLSYELLLCSVELLPLRGLSRGALQQ
jgi:hypothetical protein